MRNIKMVVEYDGSNFKGFQKLKDNENTIQGKLESVLSQMADENIEIIGSGRTDMGVHAYGQVVNFKTNSPLSLNKMHKYLYEYLPQSIAIREIEEVDDRFHSRYNAKRKVYLYKIDNNEYPNPFNRKYTCHVPKKLDLDKMRAVADVLVGEHDFTSFCSSRSKKKSHVREIYSISINENNGLIEIYVEGNRFLYNMVRIIAGTLIDAGHNKITPEEVKNLLELKDRSKSPETAPSKGLFLYRVKY